MFIVCSKIVAINLGKEGEKVIPAGYVGAIDDKLAKHWYVQALIKDGTIKTADNPAKAEKKAKQTESPVETPTTTD